PLGPLRPYHVIEERGRGGFGVVLRAFDEVLNRVVALKVLWPELAASPADRARFEREARAAAAIRDEGVVAVFQVGTAPDFPLPFLVMECVEGESLRQRLRREAP